MDVDSTAKIRRDMMEDKISWKVITHQMLTKLMEEERNFLRNSTVKSHIS
jgi:hypothetical protein